MNTSRFHEHLASEFSNDDQPTAPAGKHDLYDSTDIIISQIREATSAPSPLTGYLKDPAVIDAIDSPEGTRSRSQKHPRSSGRSREPRSSSVLGLVLAEEEKQAHKLKTLLRLTGDRLDREIRRANQAVSRAEHAESRVHELAARVSKAESSKYVTELEAARTKEEIKRYKLQIEGLERDVKRLQADVALLEKQRNEADEGASRARDTARKFQMELRNVQARQIGREEGARYGMDKWFKTGRIEGWDAGHAEGYGTGRDEGYEEGRKDGVAEGQEIGRKQGRKIGRQEGFDDGWEQGRREEREHALRAFDDFFTTEIDERDQMVSRKLAGRDSRSSTVVHQDENTSTAMVGLDAALDVAKGMDSTTTERTHLGLLLGYVGTSYLCLWRESSKVYFGTIMTPSSLSPPIPGPRRRGGKEIPRLPLSAFSPPNSGTSDTFPLPPTPNLITPTGIVDSHLQLSIDAAGGFKADIAHLKPAHNRAVVLSSGGHPAEQIISSLQS